MTPDFADKLEAYIDNLIDARRKDLSERQVSHLFLGFISDAFEIKYEDIELEHHVTMTKVQKHGYVDALLGDLVIEFKRNIHTDLGANIDQLSGLYARHARAASLCRHVDRRAGLPNLCA